LYIRIPISFTPGGEDLQLSNGFQLELTFRKVFDEFDDLKLVERVAASVSESG
jgi:hypothetical protein